MDPIQRSRKPSRAIGTLPSPTLTFPAADSVDLYQPRVRMDLQILLFLILEIASPPLDRYSSLVADLGEHPDPPNGPLRPPSECRRPTSSRTPPEPPIRAEPSNPNVPDSPYRLPRLWTLATTNRRSPSTSSTQIRSIVFTSTIRFVACSTGSKPPVALLTEVRCGPLTSVLRPTAPPSSETLDFL